MRLGAQPEAAWLENLDGTGAVSSADGLFRLLSPEGRLTAVGRLTADGPRIAAVFAAPLTTFDDGSDATSEAIPDPTKETGPCV